jgi:hypothetical protein
MNKRLVTGTLTGALLLGTLAFSPGPNGDNTFGLCTAYHAGSETGQENKRKAPPFQGLEDAAKDAGYDTVAEYCDEYGQRPGGGGNGNGRG